MLRLTIPIIVLLAITFVVFPCLTHAQEPFLIDDFEDGVDKWSPGQGAGAAAATVEQFNKGYDGKGAKITIPKGSGWVVIRTPNDSLMNVNEGLEAFNMWVKGIQGSDQWIRVMFYGLGDFSGQNRWIFDFQAPADVWTLISMPFEEIQPWRGEQRPFDPTILNFLALVEEANPPLGGVQTIWNDIEFVVDEVEFGLLDGGADKPVEPLEKLSATWGQLKR